MTVGSNKLMSRSLIVISAFFVLMSVLQSVSAKNNVENESGPSVVYIPVVESEHPYKNNENNEWTINNNTGLDAARIYFNRIELEEGVDRIEIRDENDVLIQIIDTNHPNGVWSDIVPGTLIKVGLITDMAQRFWGFEIDRVMPALFDTIYYSPHPYPNNSDETKFLLNDSPNPLGTNVHFDRIELEENVDYIVIKDSNGNPYQWITGSYPNGFTSKSVPGAAIQVQLVSDNSIQAWGFNIDDVGAGSPDSPDSEPTFPDTLAESAHPYPCTSDETWILVNPDPNAKSSKVHFRRISIAGHDNLYVMDENDRVIQQYGNGTELTNTWSDYVPGRIVKLRLKTICSYDDWGFLADKIIASVPDPGLAQSDHPYPCTSDETWTLVNPDPNAKSSKVHFNRISIAGHDTLYVMDENDRVIQQYGAGTELTNAWSDYVPGRIVKLRLKTVCSYDDWGFRADKIIASVPKPGLAQSDHPYPCTSDETWTLLNPDVNASASKIHFNRISIAGHDTLWVMDENDTMIQQFGVGTELTNFWSDFVPGRVVKLRLKTVCSYNDWGFRADDFYSDTSGAPPSAYLRGIYISVPESGTIYLNDTEVANVQESGEYKILFADTGQYTIKIQHANRVQLIWVTLNNNGGITITYQATNTNNVLFAESSLLAQVSSVYLIMPHPGTINLNGNEYIQAAESGEYRIELSDPGDHEISIEYHDHIQELEITFEEGDIKNYIYLPLLIKK